MGAPPGGGRPRSLSSLSSSLSSSSTSSASFPLPPLALVVVLLLVLVPREASSFSFTLLHTGDLAAQTVAVDNIDNPCILRYNASAPAYYYSSTSSGTNSSSECVGGMPRLKTAIEAARAEAAAASSPVVLLDVGNMFQSAYDTGSLVLITYQEEAVSDLMGAMDYDAVHFNYREYLLGFAPLARFVANMTARGVAVVEANLDWAGQREFADLTILPFVTFNLTSDGGVSELVGYTAGIDGDLAKLLSTPENTSAWDEVDGIRSAVGAMQNMGVNKIIVSVSSSFVLNSVLQSVQGIDIVIVAGALYTNDTYLGKEETLAGPYPTVVMASWRQPILVVGSGYDGRRLGRLDVEFNSFGVLTSWSGGTVVLDESVDNDPDLSANVMERFVTIDAQYGEVLGVATEDFDFQKRCLFAQCTIGNWAADGMKWAGGTQIGLFDGAGLRAGFSQGNVTRGNINRTFPYFINYLRTFDLLGRYIVATLETGLGMLNESSQASQSSVAFLQVSGLNFTYNKDEEVGLRVVDVYVEVADGVWEFLDMNKAYSVATIDFLYMGGLGFTDMGAHGTNVVAGDVRVDYIYSDYIRAISPMKPPKDVRISNTTLSRRACFASNSSIGGGAAVCSGVGACKGGACQCPEGYSGRVCEVKANSESDSLGSTAIALAIALPIGLGFCLLCLCLCVLVLFRQWWSQKLDSEAWMINGNELQLIQPLGEGSFGQVWKATWRDQEVAVKMLMQEDSTSKAARQDFLAEMRIMSQLRHPNCVLFMAAAVKPQMAIVMEFMSLGSMYDLLHNELISALPHQLRAKMAYQAAKGMHFLHSSGVVHRDLKSLNILLDAKWNVKISDFGLTKLREEKETDITVGSVYWTAPEVLAESPSTDYILSDVYSFGIIMWELLTREQPYRGLSPAAVAVAVLRDNLRPNIPEHHDAPLDFVHLMTACWHQDPMIRPTFLEIMTRLSTEVGPSSSSSTSESSKPRKDVNASWTLPSGGNSSSSDNSGSSLRSSTVLSPKERPPHGEMAIVFSDITCAATLWQHDPEAMRDATVLHNETLRPLISKFGGYEVVSADYCNHGEGSFCVAFQHTADAFDWCLAAQVKLLEVEWPPSLLEHPGAGEEYGENEDRVLFRGLRVRMGVDYGATRTVKDPTTRRVSYLGPVVDHAAQITSMAHGGQVIVTAAAFDNARDCELALEKGRLRALGKFKMPDAKALKLYELKVRGLEARFFGGVSSDRTPGATNSSGEARSVVGDDMAFPEDSLLMSANLCRWVIDFNDVDVGEQIGMGSYGVVYRGKWKSVDVAIKKFINQKLDERRMLEFRAEMALLSQLQHPNVVMFIGACTKRPNLSILTEYVARGDLKGILHDPSIKLPWRQRLVMLKSAAQGIAYLHDRNIVHRDLKPSNLLVDDEWQLKVADFGFARIKEENATMTRCGTPCWTAPEIIRGEKYSEMADVYSFGIIAWEVLTRKQPYGGRNFMGVSLDVLDGHRPQIPDDCRPQYKRLIRSCWHRNAAKRLAMDKVVEVLDELLTEATGGGKQGGSPV